MENIQEISNRLRQLRLASGMEQMEVANKLGYKSDSTISKWENGKNLPVGSKLVKLAELFNTTTDYILHGKESIKTDTDLETLTSNYTELSTDGKTELVRYSGELLEAEKSATEVSEPLPLFDVLVVSHTAAASGLGRGYGYDDSDTYTVQTDIKPPRHDISTEVTGDSMEPDYQEGDILYLVDKGLTTYSGDLAVVAYGDRSYFKKVYTEKDQLRLVSLNKDYEDILLDFPPAENTHIKIFAVVGVLRKGERK